MEGFAREHRPIHKVRIREFGGWTQGRTKGSSHVSRPGIRNVELEPPVMLRARAVAARTAVQTSKKGLKMGGVSNGRTSQESQSEAKAVTR